MILYINREQAVITHLKTVELSGGGSTDTINIGYLDSVLDHIQNDDYYPTFEEKLNHLVWSINKNHCFSDGNKRLSITLGVQFLTINGYLYCLPRFLRDMENISYHLAAGRIDKELLQKIIKSFIDGENDFNEDLKFEIFTLIADEPIGFDESTSS